MTDAQIIERYKTLREIQSHDDACRQIATESPHTALEVSQLVTLADMSRGAG